ncbi:MAG: iron-containing alcohol dehydrogenase [Planctomycetes bacterium]|nr:iron-containing alcohol dehydrogenase [Planctomycetota bacterium]
MGKLRLGYPRFRQPPVAIFGGGSRKVIVTEELWRDAVLFVSGQERANVMVAETLGGLASSVPTLTKPPGEPTVEMVRHGADFLRRNPARRVIGVGGGSVLDWCRLSWARRWDLIPDVYPAGGVVEFDTPSLPDFVLVPTTCASGAEGSAVAVVMDSIGRKVAVRSPNLLASTVILDGQFLSGVAEHRMAASLADVLSHGIESFVSLAHSAFAEDAALASLRRVFGCLGAPDSSGRDQTLLEAAYLAGVAASNSSVGIVHAFAHSVARHGVSHGLGNALGLMAGIRSNAETNAMKDLVARLHLKSTDELLEWVSRAVGPAIRDVGSLLAESLTRHESRRELATAMMADACIRTNPVRVDDADVNRFLEDVGTLTGVQ